MKVGYVRVSDPTHSTDFQVNELKALGCVNYVLDKGTDSISDLSLRKIQSGDTLVVCSLNHLSLSLTKVVDVLQSLKEKNIAFFSIKEAIDSNSVDFDSKITDLKIVSTMMEIEESLIEEKDRF